MKENKFKKSQPIKIPKTEVSLEEQVNEQNFKVNKFLADQKHYLMQNIIYYGTKGKVNTFEIDAIEKLKEQKNPQRSFDDDQFLEETKTPDLECFFGSPEMNESTKWQDTLRRQPKGGDLSKLI